MNNAGLNSTTIARRSKLLEQRDHMAQFKASLLMLLGLIIVVAATEELDGGKILFVTDVIKHGSVHTTKSAHHINTHQINFDKILGYHISASA